jgi:hypothetical protein
MKLCLLRGPLPVDVLSVRHLCKSIVESIR